MPKVTGLCADCGEDVAPGKQYCERCRVDRRRENNLTGDPIKTFNARMALYFEQAICPVCGQHMTQCTCTGK
jgi:hypothetical protein